MHGEPAALDDDVGVDVKPTADSAIRVTVSSLQRKCAADAYGSSTRIVASTSDVAMAFRDVTS